jgi:hypothetical protein
MRNLDAAIRRACGNSPRKYLEARTLMANAIVASMLPDGVVKGGSAMKMLAIYAAGNEYNEWRRIFSKIGGYYSTTQHGGGRHG